MKAKGEENNFKLGIKSFFGGRILFVFITFLLFSLFFISSARAATITWLGGASNASSNWNNTARWSGGVVPTSTDEVVISATSTSLTITVTATQTASFGSLTISGAGTNTTTNVILVGNIGTGGSITIGNYGYLTQSSTVAQTITSTLTIENLGTLTHATNTSAQARIIDFSAQNIDLQSGGSINVAEKGYAGVSTGNGQGPGKGLGTSGQTASGGGHGGDGHNTSGIGGGVGYCDFTDVNTIGSSGGGGNSTGGNGGGLVRLTATGTTTLNGSFLVQGGSGTANITTAGGAGGGIKITTNVLTGTSTVNLSGGTNSSSGLKGGGGCGQIIYTTSNDMIVAQFTLSGSGGGLLHIRQSSATYGDLYSINSGLGSTTTLAVKDLTLNSLNLTRTRFVVTSTNSLFLRHTEGTPLMNTSTTATGTIVVLGTIDLGSNFINSTTLEIKSGGTFTNSSTLILGPRGGLNLFNGGALSSALTSVSSSGDFYFERGSFTPSNMSLLINGGTTTIAGYSTSTSRLELDNLSIGAGLLTHINNTSTQNHVLNISALNITIATSGSINVDGKGYARNVNCYGTGYGPGGGTGNSFTSQGAGGGGHGGAGSAGNSGNAGGNAYGSTTSVATIGSAGGDGSACDSLAGLGGGLVILNATSTLTLNGTIRAKGSNNGSSSNSGSGAGGGVNLTANIVTGTPTLFTVQGGTSTGRGGNGGGGRISITYKTSKSIVTSTVSILGGGTGGGGSLASNGATGTVSFTQSNTLPTTTYFSTPSQTSSTTVEFSFTISDEDQQATSLMVEYSTNDGVTWASSTLGDTTVSSGSITTSTGRISGIDTDTGSITVTTTWRMFADVPNITTTTAKIRITPNDGVSNGTTTTSTAFSVDTQKPTMPGNLTVFLIASSSVRLTFPSVTSTDTNFTDYRIFYSTTTPVTNTLNTVITSSTDANLGSTTFSDATSTLITGLSNATLYYFNLYAYDRWGFNTSSLTEASTTTGPGSLTPYDVTTNLDSGTQITVTWSGNTPEYYVENTTAGTNSGWISATTYTFTNLGCGTNFSFKVKARAADLTETGFSSSVTAASTANCPSGGGSSGGGGSYTPPPTPTTTPSPTNTPTPNPTDPSNTPSTEDPTLLANRIERIKQYCPNLKPGDEFKVVGKPAIFILGNDYRPRYFPNGNVYKTYKLTYGGYIKVAQDCIKLAMDPPTNMPTAINPRAGSVLVTFDSTSPVSETTEFYAVLPNNTLAPITTDVATTLYGTNPSIMNMSERDRSQFTTKAPAITLPKVHVGMTITIKEQDNTVYYVDTKNKLREVPPSAMESNFFLQKFVYTISQSTIEGIEKGGVLSEGGGR